ncbi:MAG: hypothetical protein SVV80_12370 [Planctomycetota bacterium]|nr:hypothetical protein [Planctomycetota bacterium]
MSILRLFAIIMIFGTVSLAWMALGGTMWARTEMLDDSLSQEMASLWGPEVLVQTSPWWSPQRHSERGKGVSVAPAASKITADIRHEHRYKGLLWYNTFAVTFSAEYSIPAVEAEADGFFIFHLPEGITSHDGLHMAVDGKDVNIPVEQKQTGKLSVPLARDAEHVVSIAFTTYGQDVWLYAPAEVSSGHSWEYDEGVISTSGTMTELKDFSLTITTNFPNINYPKGARSPIEKADPDDGGMSASWQYVSSVTNQAMGIEMPPRPNAGPTCARMSFFAPVSLLFFITVLFTVVVLKKVPLHPMHYLFISAGFFAFHILLAYLVDVVENIHSAFWICSAVSVFLVVSYMRLVAGVKFAVAYVGLAQLVYLVGFSYAFFWPGKTGLTVTIGAIATLFVLMQATGKVRWAEVLRKRDTVVTAPPSRQ